MILKLQNIKWKIWTNEIIKWIDLDIKKPQAIWIVWPNGCWKTSIINLINWFNECSEWKIEFYWTDITKYSVENRANLWIWRVFQSPWIFKNLSLFENLSLAFVKQLWWKYKFLPLSFLPKNVKLQIKNVLKQLDLYNKKNELAGNLSWWQMRLLEIARLYLQDTKIFLLDEPTAWVSPKLKNKVIEFINKIIYTGKTVVIVEHDFSFLWKFVDRLIVVDSWKIILDWDYDKIKAHKKIKQVYFWK